MSSAQIPMRDWAHSISPAAIGQPITKAAQELHVRAWIINHSGTDAQVDAEATAWTARAVHIRYRDEHDREGSAWVWASAVTRRSPSERTNTPPA